MERKLTTFKIVIVMFLIAMALSVLIVVQANAQITFSAKTDFTTGTNPYYIATADFNGDGKQDIAVANAGSNTVSVFFNTTAAGASTPTFSVKTDFTTGSNPFSVTAGDINGDGKPDLSTTNKLSTTVSVFLNTTTTGAATPTFSAKTDFATGTNPNTVSICDINGDGKGDLVVTNAGSNTISVLRNTTTTGASTPTFAAKTDFTTGTTPCSHSTGDFNADGKQDVAVVNITDNEVSVLLNTTTTGSTTLTFSAHVDFTIGNNSASISINDLNGDGKKDFIAVNSGSNSVSVLLNTTSIGASTPTFSAKTDFTTGTVPYTGTIGDINNDGRPDMMVVNGGPNSVSVYINNTTPGASTPSFISRQDFTTGALPRYVSMADFNGDGKADLVTANYNAASISVLFNTMPLGADTVDFTTKTDFATGFSPNTVSTGDFNLDGKTDFATSNFASNTVSVFLNTTIAGASTPTFSAKTDFTAGTSPRGVSAADINGDGKPDMAVVNQNANSVSVFLNTTSPGAATPTFTAKTDFALSNKGSDVLFGDFNGDGKSDMAVTVGLATVISVFLNTTTPGASTPTFAARKDLTTGSGPFHFSIADFNGDGKPDIVVANSSVSTVSVLLNTTTPGSSTATFSAKTDFTVGTQPAGVTAGDINGDGKPDLVAANQVSITISVLLNTTTPGATTPTFSAKTDYSAESNPVYSLLKDLDGDGKKDIIIANQGDSSVSVFLNTTTTGASTPTFASKIEFATGKFPTSASIADFNSDGKPDIATSNGTAHTVSILLNSALYFLPVELSSFTASVQNQNVNLEWTTVMEENNSGFEIERKSLNKNNWRRVGFVQGQGTSNTAQTYSFSDRNLTTGRYSYRLKQIDYNGNFEYHELSSEVIIGVPAKYALAQNYPNPFNPSTIINYQLAINSFVSLKVYDLSGREIARLVNEVKEAGYYSVQFDAKNLSSGTYFYKLSTDKFSDVKKMVVVK